MSTIPASQIVSVNPAVLPAGGNALNLNGLMLSTAARVPIGTVATFATAQDVADYFGAGSTEANLAAVYFAGFEDSNVKPGSLLFAQYNTAAVGAFLRGGALGMTLDELKALSAGEITITVNGSDKTSASIDLSGATSFSNAAALILAGFTSPGFTVTYDSVIGAFVFTDSTTGASSTLSFATDTVGTLATDLRLVQAGGAVLSPGADAASPSTFMNALVQVTQNWATFMTAFDPDAANQNTVKLAFATWAGLQNNRYAYVCWDTDLAPSASNPASSSLGQLLKAADISGTILIGRDANGVVDASYAAFVCGAAASIDFTETNGRITFAFRRQSGLVATVSDATAAANLIANGYNFYGAYATANDLFVWLYNGSVSGEFEWADSYVNQIWLNNALQLALMLLLQTAKSVPYNVDGYTLINAACLDPINAALNFGAIRAGVTLSSAQAAEVNSGAGVKIDDILQTQGWYLQIKDAQASVRQARQSPPITLWYMDGQSVQQINLASILVQ